eukprot:CAMPEP_0197870014 /NCGR_PEP_ID=MMETSP1439-20131203/800_1 /TAXON_ID=66791 /ORGANISM="Gonyaulax spinifera, Strain CCMP409" /LENGTH=283 /DNA_ID=CAMNT_0043488891 /DNA_START=176 /DNA_END=1025 /DNA_ORIENTATION=-
MARRRGLSLSGLDQARRLSTSGRSIREITRFALAPDSHANNLNPNHPNYWKCRGLSPPTGKEKEQVAQKAARRKKAQGYFTRRAQNLAPKDKVPQEVLDVFLTCARQICGGSSRLRKKGSRSKGTAILGSDFDFELETEKPMTVGDRDQILKCLRHHDIDVQMSGKTGCEGHSFKVYVSRPEQSIDIFPRQAEWHPKGIPISDSPGDVRFTPAAQNTIRQLKRRHGHQKPCELEQLVLDIQREKGWNDGNDPGGEKRFQEAQRRLRNGEDSITIQQSTRHDVR